MLSASMLQRDCIYATTIIRDNHSQTQPPPSDADIDSLHTVIENNWSRDNQGGLFSLCNNPNDDTNVTDGTIVRFNVSENDGIRAFGFSGLGTHSIIYNNTVLIGPGHREAIVEARPFSTSKPRFADGATFFNNVVIILGEASYDFAGATHMQFDSNCFIGSVKNPFSETDAVTISRNLLPRISQDARGRTRRTLFRLAPQLETASIDSGQCLLWRSRV
jgi:hypothetical protein